MGESISYPNFSSTAGLTLLDNAGTVGTVMRLSPSSGATFNRGGFNVTNPLYLLNGFTADFDFEISDPTNGGGDGFAFVIHPDGPRTIGDGASGLGFARIDRSVAVEFNDWKPWWSGEPNDNYVAIQSTTLLNGTLPNSPYDPSLAWASPDFRLIDGGVHFVRVQYTPGILDVYLDSLAAPFISAPVDLANPLLDFPGGMAWLGFTSGIDLDPGGPTANYDIVSFSVTTGTPEPSTATVVAAGLVVLAGLLRRSAKKGKRLVD
jgi:hypothetical protein